MEETRETMSLVSSSNCISLTSDENISTRSTPGKSIRKRRYSEADKMSESSSTEDMGNSRELDQERSSGSKSVEEGVCVPLTTSEWDDNVLQLLHINIIHEIFDPCVIFNSYSDFLSDIENKNKILALFSSQNSLKPYAIKKLYDFAVEHIINLDCEEMRNISTSGVVRLCQEARTFNKEIMKKRINSCVPMHNGENIENSHEYLTLCTRIYDRVSDFLKQLVYMTKERNRNSDSEDLIAGMYQELFVRFAKIFGLDFLSAPNLVGQSFKIGSGEISSVPDALLYDPLRTYGKSSVCAVAQVKKDYSNKEDQGTKRNKKPKGNEHIYSKLKGQHVGEILSVLPYSMFGPSGMFGFLVQATEVTMVSFTAKEGFIDRLKLGNLLDKDCATVRFSEKCNILEKRGRLALVQTMIDMGNLIRYLQDL